MPTSRFSVEIDSTGDPAALLAELRRICDLAFTSSRVQRTITSSQDRYRPIEGNDPIAEQNRIRYLEATSGYSPSID